MIENDEFLPIRLFEVSQRTFRHNIKRITFGSLPYDTFSVSITNLINCIGDFA